MGTVTIMPSRRLGMEPFKNVAYQEQLNAAYNG